MIDSTFRAWRSWLDRLEAGEEGKVSPRVTQELRKIFEYSVRGNGGLFPAGSVKDSLDGFELEWDDGRAWLHVFFNYDEPGEYEWLSFVRDGSEGFNKKSAGGDLDGSARGHWKLAHRLWRMFS